MNLDKFRAAILLEDQAEIRTTIEKNRKLENIRQAVEVEKEFLPSWSPENDNIRQEHATFERCLRETRIYVVNKGYREHFCPKLAARYMAWLRENEFDVDEWSGGIDIRVVSKND